MAAASRLGRQLQEVVATLDTAGAPFALIGGLAPAPYKVIRATQDIDLLTDAAMSDVVHAALLGLGYQCLYRSADAASYLRGDERVDFIYAHRPSALRLLRNAKPLQTGIAANRESLDMNEVMEYFRLFGREPLLEELQA